MTIEELIAQLQRSIDTGQVEPHDQVRFRDYAITDERMENGANGYAVVEEALVVQAQHSPHPGVYLLGEEGLHA